MKFLGCIFVLQLAALSQGFAVLQPASNRLKNVGHQQSMVVQGAPAKLIPAALSVRGGSTGLALIENMRTSMASSPTGLFNGLFVGLAALAVASKAAQQIAVKQGSGSSSSEEKPKSVISLQARFLAVFWLVRMSDWLQGPYFYEVYASKIFNGVPASIDTISKLFLMGFATTGILGPWVGRQVDIRGRRAGTIAFTVLYALGALSTRANSLLWLYLGRIAGGVGTSLLFSAPEAWMVGEHQRSGHAGRWVGQTFGWAYAGDALVAILAGQCASSAAAAAGPTGPYTLSLGFLSAAAALALAMWKENRAPKESSGAAVTIKDAWEEIRGDPKVMLVGAVQALFEGAMYTFVIQWVPALRAAIEATGFGPPGAPVPFGKVFSCFMVCCLLGTTAFGGAQARGVPVEASTLAMLAVGTAAMGAAAALGPTSLTALVAAFFVFEACVGTYFPSIGTLRSKYISDRRRSVVMNLFGIPLNLLVVAVFLSLKRLGVRGALGVSAGALGLGTLCMAALARLAAAVRKEGGGAGAAGGAA